MTELHTMLKRLGACSEAVNWSNGKKLQEVWNTCERPDWMMWLCAKMIGKKGWPTHQQIVLAACDCAETALLIFEKKYPKDSRPRTAIETARKWVNGEATIEEVRAAANAAAAYATDAAGARIPCKVNPRTGLVSVQADIGGHAYAAAYAAAANAAAYAAVHAAVNAANAAHAAYLGALSSKRKELANLVRKQLIIPTE